MLRPTLILCLALAACGPTRTDRAQTALANPAGQNCLDHGGKLILLPNGPAQKAYCKLPGRTIGATEFFAQTNP